MKYNEIEKLFAKINKNNPDNNPFYSAINLTNAYLSKYGTEHDLLKKIYGKYLFAYLLEYCNNIKKSILKNRNKNVFDNFMYQVRTKTYNLRRSFFYSWINCVTEQKGNNNELVNSLYHFYDLSDIKKVKELLGLNYKLDK